MAREREERGREGEPESPFDEDGDAWGGEAEAEEAVVSQRPMGRGGKRRASGSGPGASKASRAARTLATRSPSDALSPVSAALLGGGRRRLLSRMHAPPSVAARRPVASTTTTSSSKTENDVPAAPAPNPRSKDKTTSAAGTSATTTAEKVPPKTPTTATKTPRSRRLGALKEVSNLLP